MKDIDFDELDKAVNSLMATTPQAAPSPAAPEPAAAPAQPADVPLAPPPAAASEAIPVTVSQPVPVVTRPVAPAARRGGRFMDMVHTSSDMKQRETTPPTNSREGLAITPRSEQTDSPEPIVAPQPTVEQTAESVPVSMPDPIDLALSPQSDLTTIEAEPAIPSAEQTAEPASLAPIESPFLTDAKVEKRPLNAGMADATPMSDVGLEMDSLQDPQDTDTPVDDTADNVAEKGDEPPASPQIPELSSDLVAIESSEKVETQAVETSDAASQVEVPSVPLGASSIAQQYTTQASTGDQSHAAIYDASQYPEPVAHPAKHKSGWLWVLWVVLLLGVGAGGAVLLYTFGIIP